MKSSQKKLRKYVEGHAETIAVKAEVMVEHFMDRVVASKMLKGKAKGMVVTSNIVSAIRYYFAIRELLAAGADPNITDDECVSVLAYAKDAKTVQILVDGGADLHGQAGSSR